MAIGDRIQPGLGRADTSGILRGSMAGAEALGQGITALGAGVGAGIKQRKKDEKDVTATVARLEALKKAQAPDSPLIGVLDEGINTLSDTNLSPRKAAGLAAGYNQSVTDFFDSVESGLKQEAAKRDAAKFDATFSALQADAGMRASAPEAMSKAFTDFADVGGDIDAFQTRIKRRVGGILNPEQAQKDQQDAASLQKVKEMGLLPNVPGMDKGRLSYLEELQQLPPATFAIGEMQGEAFGTDLGDPDLPAGGGILPALAGPTKEQRVAAYLQAANEVMDQSAGDLKIEYRTVERTVNGKEVKQMVQFINDRETAVIGEVSKGRMYSSPEEEEEKRRGLFDQKAQQERITNLATQEQLAFNYVRALELLKGVKRDKTYDDLSKVRTGVGAELKLKIDRLGSLLGIEESRIQAANAQELYALFGGGVMAQIAKTKGAVSEKEMTYFALISPGLDKEEQANKNILENQLKFLKREIDIGRLTKRLRYEGKTVAEIEKAHADYYENNRILSDERIDAALRAEGYDPEVEYENYRRPGQRPSRRDTSVPSAARQRAQGLGDRLRDYNVQPSE